MIYLTEILGSYVKDSSDAIIGRLDDVLVTLDVNHYSPILYIRIKQKKNKQPYYIPFKYVENFGRHEIMLNNIFDRVRLKKPEKDSIYLARYILDKQIIDVEGARVFRVNDVKLMVVEKKLSAVGLDVSWRAILRRMNLEWADIFNFFHPSLIDWRNTQPVHGVLKLDTISKKLKKLHPADLANIIEELNIKQGTNLMESLHVASSAKTFEEIEPNVQKIIIGHLNKKVVQRIVNKMPIDELTDLLQNLPEDRAEHVSSYLEKEKQEKVEELIAYEEDTAGGLMNTEFVSIDPTATVEEAIVCVKELSASFRSLLYVYVVDKKGKFIGPISMRTLLISDPSTKIKLLVKSVEYLTTLHPHTSFHTIVNIMTKYNLFAATVVDKKGKLLGVVTIDDVMRCLAPKA